MTRSGRMLFWTLVLASAVMLPVSAQTVPRVKGKIADFDGLSFRLAPEDGSAPLLVQLLPQTRIAAMEKTTLAVFKAGAFAGATVTVGEDRALHADEIHLYPDALRGAGEGRIAQANRFVVNGSVIGVGEKSLTLFYRGASETDGVCLGRADTNAAQACRANAVIQLGPDTVISRIVPADRRALVASATATVSIQTAANGSRTTPGLIVESGPVAEKPQNTP